MNGPFRPKTAPGPLQILQQLLVAANVKEGLELAGTGEILGIFFATGGADGDKRPPLAGVRTRVFGEVLGEAIIGRDDLVGNGRRNGDLGPNLPDLPRFLRIVQILPRQDGIHRIIHGDDLGREALGTPQGLVQGRRPSTS